MTNVADADRIAVLEEDNRRLRRLLDQRDAPGELRHSLRSTLALLVAIVRRSAATPRDLAGYVAHLEDRLDAIARAHLQADQTGEVDLRTLIADELLVYGALEDGQLTLSGPELLLEPRFGRILALAIHELAINAVEHGTLGVAEGRVEVSWSLTGSPDQALLLTWAETARSGGARSYHGFGTEVLERMLPDAVKAEVATDLGPGTLRCTMRIPHFAELGRLATG